MGFAYFNVLNEQLCGCLQWVFTVNHFLHGTYPMHCLIEMFCIQSVTVLPPIHCYIPVPCGQTVSFSVMNQIFVLFHTVCLQFCLILIYTNVGLESLSIETGSEKINLYRGCQSVSTLIHTCTAKTIICGFGY